MLILLRWKLVCIALLLPAINIVCIQLMDGIVTHARSLETHRQPFVQQVLTIKHVSEGQLPGFTPVTISPQRGVANNPQKGGHGVTAHTQTMLRHTNTKCAATCTQPSVKYIPTCKSVVAMCTKHMPYKER
jgi:hypothetical protein